MEQDNEQELLAKKVASFYQVLMDLGLEQWVALTLTQQYMFIRTNEQPIPVGWPTLQQKRGVND